MGFTGAHCPYVIYIWCFYSRTVTPISWMCFNETSYKHHHFPWYCYVFFHGIWLVFMFFMVFHGSRFTIVNDAIFLLSHQDRCFWSSMTIACNYFQWSVTIGPPMWWLRCIAQLQTCYQAVSNITIKISNKIRDLQVDIINSQNHFTQVSPALCEVVP